jgi:hypothetical protein
MFDARAVAHSYQFDLSMVLEWESTIIELSGHYGAGGDYSLTAIVEKLTTAHIHEIYTHLTTQSITINLSLCIRVTVARVTHQVTSLSPPPPPRQLSAAFVPIARPSTGHQRHSAGHAPYVAIRSRSSIVSGCIASLCRDRREQYQHIRARGVMSEFSPGAPAFVPFSSAYPRQK